MSDLGRFIKEKREALGLSQKKLGLACGVSDSEIYKIETGTRKSPSWLTLCEIAKVLSFHPFELLLMAGYITENDIHPNSKIHGLDKLSSSEIDDVQLFIDFLISKNKKADVTDKEAK